MCVAIACETVLPDKETIDACEKTNPDGGGVAWVEDGKVKFKKSVTGKEITEMIEKGIVKAPALIHFRISTVGGTRPELCHPFPIAPGAPLDLEGEAEGALIHNGHLSGWGPMMFFTVMKNDKKCPDGHWSDSRFMAYAAYHRGVNVLRSFDFQKIAVLHNTGNILLYGDFTKREKIYYSNTHWQTSKFNNTIGASCDNVLRAWEGRDRSGKWVRRGRADYWTPTEEPGSYYDSSYLEGAAPMQFRSRGGPKLWRKAPKDMDDAEFHEWFHVRNLWILDKTGKSHEQVIREYEKSTAEEMEGQDLPLTLVS
jgi:hypothetical protein